MEEVKDVKEMEEAPVQATPPDGPIQINLPVTELEFYKLKDLEHQAQMLQLEANQVQAAITKGKSEIIGAVIVREKIEIPQNGQKVAFLYNIKQDAATVVTPEDAIEEKEDGQLAEEAEPIVEGAHAA